MSSSSSAGRSASKRSKAASRALHPGAVEHYEAAEAYESRYSARSEDVEFYRRKARGNNAILEFGAGAGRLTLPLARDGKELVAVDPSVPMLSLLKKRLLGEKKELRARVVPRKGDMRTFRSNRSFDLVIAGFHTVCHLYSEQDMVAFLETSLRALRPGGALHFDLPLPRIDVPGYDPIAQVRVTEMEGPDGGQLLTQRWYQPQEILSYLHYTGFRRAKLGSDFGSEPPHAETSIFTVSARKPC